MDRRVRTQLGFIPRDNREAHSTLPMAARKPWETCDNHAVPKDSGPESSDGDQHNCAHAIRARLAYKCRRYPSDWENFESDDRAPVNGIQALSLSAEAWLVA